MKLWSPNRVKAYKTALQRATPPALAILRIPRLTLEVPVYDGTTDAVLETPVATEQYRVEWIRITIPTDVSVIAPTPGPAVTLVGCYPFYHVGPAPQRFIVRAVPTTATRAAAGG